MNRERACFRVVRAFGSIAIALSVLSLQGCGVISYGIATARDEDRIRKEDNRVPYDRKSNDKFATRCPDGSADLNACPKDRVRLNLPPSREAAGYKQPAAIARLKKEFTSSSDLAPGLLPMAYLANVVYHRHQSENERSDPDKACIGKDLHHYPDPKAHPLGDRTLDLQSTIDAQRADDKSGGWRRWGQDDAACFAKDGLFYDTYVRFPTDPQSIDDPVQIAIVFRGTENYLAQAFHDWTDNFLSAMGVSPRQYTLAIDRLKITMDAIKTWEKQKNIKQLKIFAVGHSLGGGLAQQAGYLYPEIDTVYAFNSSPVTNWTQLMLWDDGGPHVKSRDPVVFRVEQNREFLDYLRFVSNRFVLARFNRVDVQFNFGNDGPVGGHSIAKLTCHLAARAADVKPAPGVNSVDIAVRQGKSLLTDSKVEDFGCDDKTLKYICESSPFLSSAAHACMRLSRPLG